MQEILKGIIRILNARSVQANREGNDKEKKTSRTDTNMLKRVNISEVS